MAAFQPMQYQNRHICKHVAPIIQTGLFALGWCGSGNRYDDVTASEPMMFVTVLLPYCVFRFVCISGFVIFLIGCNGFVDPQLILSLAWPLPPAPQMDRCSSPPMSFLFLLGPGKAQQTQCAKSLRDSIARVAQDF
jgi:hypothetical protein